MDDLVTFIQTEVALDGGAGCSWDRLWYLVNEYFASRGSLQKTDEKFRKFFWDNFVLEEEILLKVHELSSTTQDTPSIQDPSRASSVPVNELKLLNPEDASYETIVARHKDRIRIVASLERQQVAALGHSGSATGISAQSFEILQSITASRSIGVTQAQLARERQIDPRSMFHFLKVLISMKLVVKIPVTTDGQYTLLCLHRLFASKNPGYKAMNSEDTYVASARPLVTGDGGRRFEGLLRPDAKSVSYYSGLIKQKLTDILGRSKNQIMMIDDLAKALELVNMNSVQSRWFQRQVELLCKLKYIKRVSVPGKYRCVQLLRPYGSSVASDESEKEHLNLKAVIADDTPQSGIYIDTSIEHQVYKHIVEAKERGTTAKEIRMSMNKLNRRLLARILETLARPAGGADSKAVVNRVVEFVGRERRYRYYSEAGYKESVEEDHKEYIQKAQMTPNFVRPRNRKPASTSKQPSREETDQEAMEVEQVPDSTALASDSAEASSSAPNATDTVARVEPPSARVDPTSTASDLDSPSGSQALTEVALPTVTHAATPARFVSVALLQRRKILLSLLERKRILEVQASLVQEYQQEKQALFPDLDEKSVIDRRTVFRTVTILEEEGLAKIYKVQNIPVVGGGAVTKTFCMHPSLDPESSVAQQFVKDCTNRHLLFGSQSQKPQRKPEETTLEAETLVQLQTRLGNDFIPQKVAVPFTEMGSMETPSTLKSRESSKLKKEQRGPDFEGMQFALEFGWYKAKMMRAIVFHRFILERLSKPDPVFYSLPKNPRVFSTASLFEMMPLKIYLKIVGIVQEPSDETRRYLKESKESNIPISHLPAHTSFLARPSTIFKRRLLEVLEILDCLGLVSPLTEDTSILKSADGTIMLKPGKTHTFLNTHYETHVDVHSPKSPADTDISNPIPRKAYDLSSLKECRDFWADLQAFSSTMTGAEAPRYRSVNKPWADICRDFISNLNNKRLWTDPVRIRKVQQEVLMKYVDQSCHYTPLTNSHKMSSIATESGLRLEDVNRFYRALLTNWKSAASKPFKQKVPRLSRVKRAGQALESKRMRQDENQTVKIEAPADTGIPKDTHTSNMTMDTSGSVDMGLQESVQDAHRGGRFAVGGTKLRRRKRLQWTKDEDDQLLRSSAVVRYVSTALQTRFSWGSVAMGMGNDMMAETCRHRWTKISKDLSVMKRLEDYRIQFGYAYPDIAKQFTIPLNLQAFNPAPILEHFRPKLDLSSADLTATMPMPNDVSLIPKLFDIRQDRPMSSLYVEDVRTVELSEMRRLALLDRVPFTLRIMNGQELDLQTNELEPPFIQAESISGVDGQASGRSPTTRGEKLCQEHLILSIIRANFSVPHSKRNLDLTRFLLGQFEPAMIQTTCQWAKEWKLMITIKNSSYRIPGQRVGSAERFTSVLDGVRPRLLSLAAKDADVRFSKEQTRMFQEDISPADMMVLLTDIAVGQLRLDMVQAHDAMRVMQDDSGDSSNTVLSFNIDMVNTRESANTLAWRPTHKTLKRSGEFEQESSSVRAKDTYDSSEQTKRSRIAANHVPDPPVHDCKELRSKTIKDFQKYLTTVPGTNDRRLYKAIFELILASESKGVLLVDIKEALIRNGILAKDEEIRTSIRTLVSKSSPALVKIGMAEFRLVIMGWHQSWTVNYQTSNQTLADCMDGEAPFDPSGWQVPRIWTTLDGHLNKIVLEKCLHAVLVYIVEKPGVSKGALQKHFYKVILGAELEEILEQLEERKAIYQKSGILPKPVRLFSKRSLFTPCSKDTIDERKVTNYFPRPAYYSFLDMSLVMSKASDPETTEEDIDDWTPPYRVGSDAADTIFGPVPSKQ